MPSAPDRKDSVFIQFAGQGVKYMDELRRLYAASPRIQPFMQDAIAEVKRQAAAYDDSRSAFFTQGLDVDRWIEQPETTPDLGYLLSSPLSHPLIYLCQISSYLAAVLDGMDQDLLLRHTHSATGFSTGVVAAILVSLGLDTESLWKMAIRVQAMFFWQGVRTQQSMLNYGERPRLDPELYESEEGSPSCMANVTGVGKQKLDELLASFTGDGSRAVYPAYELLPARWIVAGLPGALAAFGAAVKARVAKATWRYIPSTIAAHCPYLSYALETSPRDAEQLGVVFPGQEMRIPVWSNDTGEDLRTKEDIVLDLMRAYFTRPAFWRKQIAPLFAPGPITHVLDFGPGTGVASLTESYTHGTDVQVLRCTLPLGRWKLFEELLPALSRP